MTTTIRMRAYLLVSFLLVAATAGAQGAITVGTPITFAAPTTISGYDPDELVLRPGASAQILVTLHAKEQPGVKLVFEYPRDCGSFGASGNPPVPNPPVCPARDSSSEVDALITTLNKLNLSGVNQSLWQRVFTNVCADFPGKFPGGCTVQ